MFNYQKVDDLELRIISLKNTIEAFGVAQGIQKAEMEKSNKKLKETTSQHEALLVLVERYLNAKEEWSPFSYALGAEYMFEESIKKLENHEKEKVERAKIESIVRDLLKKNVFKEVKK